MRPQISHAAANSIHVLRNACEALVAQKQPGLIKNFKEKFQAAEDKTSVLAEFFEILPPKEEQKARSATSLFSVLQHLSTVFFFWSRNANRPASNADLRAWIENGHVEINGFVSKDLDEEIDFPVVSMVLFKGAKTQLTLF